MIKRTLKIPKSKLIIIAIAVVFEILLLLSLIWSPSIEKLFGINNPFSTVSEGSPFKIHFIDVGQGDATVVEFSDGKKLLFDAGDTSSETALNKYFNDVLFKNEKWEFEFVIASHSDTDHVGNMAYIFEKCQVNNVYRPKIFVEELETVPHGAKTSTEVAYKNFVSLAGKEPNCNIYFIENGYSYVSSGVDYTFSFLTTLSQTSSTEDNDFSPITIIKSKGKSVCLTGDASSSVEKEVISQNVIGQVDIIKAGHHGSKYSTCEQFLVALNPSYAVISCGVNSYGHPTDEVLNRLSTAVGGNNIYRTDKQSNIIFYLDGEELMVCYGALTSADSLDWWLIVLCASLLLFSLVLWCLRPTRAIKQAN